MSGKALVTGASGTVGRFIAAGLLNDGYEVTALGRAPVAGLPLKHHVYDLGDLQPDLPSADVLVHCALAHVPGKFRGGEGDDPAGFVRLNVDGTIALFETAKRAGIGHIVFLSSRAVYGDQRRAEILRESDPPAPGMLYGDVKLKGEQALASLCGPDLTGSAMRATGVYGLAPGLATHKWSDLFADFLAGKPIPPRAGTEVHGKDLAEAVGLVLRKQAAPFEIFNVSGLMLDRRDLLALFAGQQGVSHPLPNHAEAPLPAEMDTTRLSALGWQPGGLERVKAFLTELR